MPETRHLDSFRVPVFTGSSPLPDLKAVKGIWLIVPDDAPLDQLQLCSDQYPEASRFGRLLVYRVPCVP
jgi:hypothetical protein